MPVLTGLCSGSNKPITDVALIPLPPMVGEVAAVAQTHAFDVTPLRALLDTGADGTSISSTVARTQNLINYGKRTVIGFGGSGLHNTWGTYIGFLFGQDADFEGDYHKAKGLFMFPEPQLAVEMPPNGWFDVIIGRDILTHFDFRMFRGGRWELDLA